MTGLKKQRELLQSLADALELPAEALGAAKLTVTGRSRALIENHAGVVEYSAERIVVNAGGEKLVLSGTGLHLLGMNRSELLIGGSLQLVEWM